MKTSKSHLINFLYYCAVAIVAISIIICNFFDTAFYYAGRFIGVIAVFVAVKSAIDIFKFFGKEILKYQKEKQAKFEEEEKVYQTYLKGLCEKDPDEDRRLILYQEKQYLKDIVYDILTEENIVNNEKLLKEIDQRLVALRADLTSEMATDDTQMYAVVRLAVLEALKKVG